MRTVGSLIALVVSLASVPVGATDATEPPPLPPPEQHTVVRGTLPRDLPGRWMAVGWIALPDGKARTTPTLWQIKQDDQPVLTVRFAALPPAQQKALDDANTAEQRWRPSPVDIAQLAAAVGPAAREHSERDHRARRLRSVVLQRRQDQRSRVGRAPGGAVSPERRPRDQDGERLCRD